MTGQFVGSYRLIEKLGEGGMGFVYKGIDVMVEREVAVKMLRPEIASRPDIVERFRAEAVTLAKLNHPNIATLFNFLKEGNQYFMVMEYVPGRSLDAIIREHGRLGWDVAVPILGKVLEGIDHAHRQGILHRDIKPANIMITGAGAVKVTDFGIARVLGSARMTREGRIVGTIEYLAPERIRGEAADTRSDIYSLGAVLFEMLSGRIPFESDTEFTMMKMHLENPVPSLAAYGVQVPPGIEAVIAQAMAKQPEHRFHSAEAMRIAMLTAAGMAPVPAVATSTAAVMRPTRLATDPDALRPPLPVPPAPTAVRPAKPGPRFGWKHYAAAGAIALVFLLAAILYLLRPEPKPPVVATPPPQPAVQGGAAPASEILKHAVPLQGELPGIPGPATGSPAPTPTPQRPKAESPAEVERRRAALRALESGAGAKKDDAQERELRRKRALEALEK